MNLYAVILISILCMLFFSCEKHCRKKDDKLSIPKTNYTGSINTNGYYYGGNDVYIFYRNGISLGTHPSNLQVFEDGIGKESYSEKKFGWGLFQIENDNIRIEEWGVGQGCGYPAYVMSGVILNDSMFVIKESYRVHTKENYIELNDTFRFKQTSSKPDSTQPYL